MFYDNLKDICQKQGVSVTAVIKEIGLNPASGTYWKKGSFPSGDILIKLSKRLNVTIDFLLGLDNVPNRQLDNLNSKTTNTENRLLSAFRELSFADQMIEVGRIELMAEQANKAKNSETA